MTHTTFRVRINEDREQEVTVNSSNYRTAVMVALGTLDYDTKSKHYNGYRNVIKIWNTKDQDLNPGPFYYGETNHGKLEPINGYLWMGDSANPIPKTEPNKTQEQKALARSIEELQSIMNNHNDYGLDDIAVAAMETAVESMQLRLKALD